MNTPQIKKIVSDFIGLREPLDTTKSLKDYDCDSLDAVELMINVEEQTGLDIDDDLFDMYTPISTIIEKVEGLR